MKKALTIICCVIFLSACGGKQQEAATNELTMEQEQAVADSLSSTIDQSREELATQTEEDLQEIDSLLENF